MSTYLSLYVLHVTIELGGAALKLRAMSHSCYVIWCVRPGRVLGLAGPHLRPSGWAGPGFRPDHNTLREKQEHVVFSESCRHNQLWDPDSRKPISSATSSVLGFPQIHLWKNLQEDPFTRFYVQLITTDGKCSESVQLCAEV